MFYLQGINLVESVLQGLTGGLTLRPPTNRPRDIPTHMICHWTFHLLWQFTTVTLRPCNILLPWQMDPVTFYYCNTWSPIWYVWLTNVHLPLKVGKFCHCIMTSTFFLHGLRQDIHFCSEAKCGHFVTCHQGTPGSLLSCFTRGGQNVTIVKIIMHKIVKSRCNF